MAAGGGSNPRVSMATGGITLAVDWERTRKIDRAGVDGERKRLQWGSGGGEEGGRQRGREMISGRRGGDSQSDSCSGGEREAKRIGREEEFRERGRRADAIEEGDGGGVAEQCELCRRRATEAR